MGQVRRGWQALGRAVCVVLTLHAVSGAAQAASDQWRAPAAELAKQIAAATGPGTVALSVKNLSSIRAEEVPRIQALLVKELSGAGVQVRAAGTDVNDVVRVTLSQSARQGLWVGEVQQGPEVRVTMVTVALPATAAKAHDSEVVLSRKLLLTRAEPVLDAAEIRTADGREELVVLGPEDVTVYSAATEQEPVVTAKVTIQHEQPFPRDLRGRLEVSAEGWKAYLPGVICSGGTEPGKSASCAESDDPWPLTPRRALFHAGRNFFTGVTAPALGGDPGPFYSEAELGAHRGGVAVVNTVSGGFRVVDTGGTRALAGTRDWGSDVVGIPSGCGSGVQVLASAAGDGEQDTLVAYEIEGTQALAASAPLMLSGHVTAMWAPVNGAESSAIVITEMSESGSYEVHRGAATCGS